MTPKHYFLISFETPRDSFLFFENTSHPACKIKGICGNYTSFPSSVWLISWERGTQLYCDLLGNNQELSWFVSVIFHNGEQNNKLWVADARGAFMEGITSRELHCLSQRWIYSFIAYSTHRHWTFVMGAAPLSSRTFSSLTAKVWGSPWISPRWVFLRMLHGSPAHCWPIFLVCQTCPGECPFPPWPQLAFFPGHSPPLCN